MSRDVSRLDKFVRIVGFSLYLAFIVFFFFLFFKGLKFSITLFLVSTAYFIAIFLVLTLTKHIHYNVLLRRKQLKKSFFNSVYPLSRFRIFHALSWIIIALLAVMAAIYLYYSMPVHGITLIIIAALAFFYFHVHRIGVHILKEGLAFDYGQLIVLLLWKEIKKINMKGNRATVNLKEKFISRSFYVEHPSEFRKILKKFGF